MRFLVTRRNEGLGDCLFNLALLWRFAQDTDRTLVIDWTRHTGYSRDPDENVFLKIFENPKDRWDFPVWCQERSYERSYEGLPTSKHVFNKQGVFPLAIAQSKVDCIEVNSFLLDHMSFDQTAGFYKAITLIPTVQKIVDDFADEHFGDRPVLGIHVRHGDGEKGHFVRHGRVLEKPQQIVDRIVAKARLLQDEQGAEIFLATDSLDIYDLIQEQLPDVKFRMGWRPPRNSGGARRAARGTRGDLTKVLYDAAVDMWLLQRCFGFLQPTWSHFTSYATGMGVPKIAL